MAITDLTGYTWVGNSNLSIQNEIGLFSINFTSDGTEYDIIGIGKNPQTEATKLNRLFYGMEAYTVYYNGWESEVYKTIVITGGYDATNATLIAWLEANGTLTPPPAQLTVDMSTLTGWASLSAGTHTLTVVAKATGYIDSNPSTGVQFMKGQRVDAPYIELGD